MSFFRLLDPQQGPKLPPELLERLVIAHEAELTREQDRIADIIRRRLNRPANRSTHGGEG